MDNNAHAHEAEAALARARAMLASPGPLDERRRAEALEAIDELAKALRPAIAGSPDQARSVTHFAEALAHEATRPDPQRSILGAAVDGMNHAVERLEAQYPVGAAIVEKLSEVLAQIGI